jgi:uncharacterized NAD(P)/FAD-binding protein YdhS
MTTVAIIGGGMSGFLTALRLLEHNEELSIRLINSGRPLALGVAYSTSDPQHLLNVPAGKMSAYVSKPSHFADWLDSKGLGTKRTDLEFVPRMVYASYITELFDAIKNDARLDVINDRAIGLVSEVNKYLIRLEQGGSVEADKVVLALGNFLPAAPRSATSVFLKSRNYFGDPWEPTYLEGLKTDEDILLIGTGLTMVDCVLSLKQKNFKGKMIVVSPRGYAPLSHGKTEPYPDFQQELEGRSLNAIFHSVRQHLQSAEEKGISWRAVIDSLRPHAQKLWIGLQKKEKQQFISHIRHIWGITRHRLPEKIDSELRSLRKTGQLEIIGGRILDIKENQQKITATVRLRKGGDIRKIHVARVINCTGPQTNYSEIDDPLVKDLLARGLIVPDELKMGIKATLDGQVLHNDAKPDKNMFAIGSLLRGTLWETTAIPEIRTQADRIAKLIVAG